MLWKILTRNVFLIAFCGVEWQATCDNSCGYTWAILKEHSFASFSSSEVIVIGCPSPSHTRKAQGRVGLKSTDANEQAGRPPNVSAGSGRSFLCIWPAGGSVLMSDLCIPCSRGDSISHHGKRSCSSFQPGLWTNIANPDFCEQVSKVWRYISWNKTKKCPLCQTIAPASALGAFQSCWVLCLYTSKKYLLHPSVTVNSVAVTGIYTLTWL